MTVSLWQRQPAATVECDCIVVGAGICGLSAALHLQRRGVDAVVVDRTGIGGGASARNAGFLMRGAAENYFAAIRHYGRPMAELVWQWSEENLAGLRTEGVEEVAGYQARPSCLLAFDSVEHDELRRSTDLLRDDGFKVEWIDRGDDDAWRTARPLGGLLNPDDAVCNPVALLSWLAARARSPVHAGCEVWDLRGEPGGRIRTRTSRGDFISSHVLLCTNAYLPLLLPELRGIVAPRRGQMLAIRRPGSHLACSYYANFGHEYFRQVDDEILIFGGCRRQHAEAETGYEDVATPHVQRDIQRFAADLLGDDNLHIVARWSGTMGFSPDGLPLVGPIEGEWPENGVYFCGGFTGHGMSLAFRTARSAVEAILDRVPTPFALARVNAGDREVSPRQER